MAKPTPKPTTPNNDCKCCKLCGNPFHTAEKCDYDQIVYGTKKPQEPPCPSSTP